jgi:hypothetical protein
MEKLMAGNPPQQELKPVEAKKEGLQRWTKNGKIWLAGLIEKVRSRPKEVIEEVAEAPGREEELIQDIQKIDGFRQLNEDELASLQNLLGADVLTYCKTQETAPYKADTKGNLYLESMRPELVCDVAVPFGSRSIIISPLRTASKSVQISFAFTEDVIRSSKQSILEHTEEGNALFTRQESELSSDTLRFLRFCKRFVEMIAPDCEILIKQFDEQRSRIYKKALAKMPNVKFI